MTPIPERIQRKRSNGWRMPERAVFVGRPTIWGNPWIPGRPGRVRIGNRKFPLNLEGVLDCKLTPSEAVELFRQMLLSDADAAETVLPVGLNTAGVKEARRWLRYRRATVRATLGFLAGRPLVCWCPLDCPCHADVLLDLANR